MDITCPQCKTEYEFEDAKVTEAGVTVKCTTCNFMFKVRRKAVVETEPVLPARAPAAAARPDTTGASAKPWMIRTAAGHMLQFQELTTLQQWIVERKVSRDDHISKSGETWKRLGDIAELASFFQVVDAAMAAESLRESGELPRRDRPPSSSRRRPAPSDDDGDTEPVSMGSMSGPIPGDEPAFTSSSAPAFAPVGPTAAWEEGGVRLSGRHATVEPGEEELPRGHGRLVGLLLLVVLLLGGGALALVYRGSLKSLFSGGSSGSDDPAFQAARKLFLLDDEDSLRQADQELSRSGADNALHEAARAEVLTTWASHIRDEAELLERQAKALERTPASTGEAKALRLKASTLRGEADHKLGQAELHAKRALEQAPSKPEVERAMADYRRVARSSAAAVHPFITDLEKKTLDDPEALFVTGAYWSSQGNQARAESRLTEALTKTRARYGQLLVRAAFFLSMLQLRADRRTEARAQAQAILDANPKHRWASQLIEVVRAEEQAPVAKTLSAPDARPALATRPAAGTGSGAPVAGTRPGAGSPKAGGGEPPAGATYEQLVKQGTALSEKGRTVQAFKLFERALKMKPNGVEALVGLGFCHLDQERFAQAISYFKRVLAVAPTQGEALIGMGEAYKVQGNFAKALEYYRAYLQGNPSGPKAVMAKRNVADLERKVSGGTAAPGPTPAPAPAPTPAPTPAPAPEAPPPAPPSSTP